MVVLPFNNSAALDINVSGGKGASLARLANDGFNVPPGVIITARAYREFVAQAEWLPEAVASLHLADPVVLAGEA